MSLLTFIHCVFLVVHSPYVRRRSKSTLGFDIITGALYGKDTAPVYHKIMGGN